MPLRYERNNNPYWPLPPDYNELSVEGQKHARINAVVLRETPDDDVASWLFFRNYYLNWEGANWYQGYVEPAPGHLEWVKICAAHKRVAIAAHRGSAKSTIWSGEFTLRDFVSKPNSGTLLVNSGESKVQRRLADIMLQVETNKRIIEDFGELKPKRGSRLWNHTVMQGVNGAELVGLSVESRQLRGERPATRIIADDLEADPKPGTNIDRLMEQMDAVLFNVLLPMLRKGAAFHLVGTPLRRRLYLWRIIKGEIPDPRLQGWYKAIFPGVTSDFSWDHYDPSTVFWPAEYPDLDSLRTKRLELGTAWGAEFLCAPAADETPPIVVHPVRNTYSFKDGEDPRKASDPLNSGATITWTDCQQGMDAVIEMPRSLPATEFYKGLTRFGTVDAIRKPGPHSDYAVAQSWGIDRLGQRFSLDLWIGKVRYEELATKCWEMAKKWRWRFMAVESIGLEQTLVNKLLLQSANFVETHGWVPQIVPLGPSTHPSWKMGKEERIQLLEAPFSVGLFKLPYWLRYEHPYQMLFDQIDAFTAGGENLAHDDAIDTVSFAFEVTRNRRPRGARTEKPPTGEEVVKAVMKRYDNQLAVPLAGQLLDIAVTSDFVRSQYPELNDKETVEWVN